MPLTPRNKTYINPTILSGLFFFLLFSIHSYAAGEGADDSVGSEAIVDTASSLEKQRSFDDRFILWGNTSIWMGIGTSFEYNTNINLEENNTDADLITRPQFWVSIKRQYTENNSLNLSSRAGYSYYAKNTQNNTRFLSISPDSAFVYDFQIKNIKVGIEDSVSYEEDPTSEPSIQGTTTYKRLSNSFTVSPSWKMNDSFSLGSSFTHALLKTFGERFKDQERQQYVATVSPGYNFNSQLSISPLFSVTRTVYRQDQQNDSEGRSAGINTNYNISKYLSFKIFFGYEETSYKSNGTITDTSNSHSISYSGEIKHRLTPHTSHSLQFEAGARPGFGTNFFNDNKITYVVQSQINAYTNTLASIFYETIEESGDDAEKATRIALLFNANFAIMRKTRLSLAYRFLTKNSNQDTRSYIENKFSFDFSYTF